jgi:hypothetical protein
MKKYNLPYAALVLGLPLLLIVLKGSGAGSDGHTALPLLTLLAICEVAGIIAAIAAYFGIEHILTAATQPVYKISTALCVMLSVGFLWLGIELWPL